MTSFSRAQHPSSTITSRETSVWPSYQGERWGVILAGGDGTRLLPLPLTRQIVGDDRPKQFCPMVGGETLLEQTARRVAHAISPYQPWWWSPGRTSDSMLRC
jgi:hypothetical protein